MPSSLDRPRPVKWAVRRRDRTGAETRKGPSNPQCERAEGLADEDERGQAAAATGLALEVSVLSFSGRNPDQWSSEVTMTGAWT